jgi:uncharacterized protein YjeT (DUF2065 family)
LFVTTIQTWTIIAGLFFMFEGATTLLCPLEFRRAWMSLTSLIT